MIRIKLSTVCYFLLGSIVLISFSYYFLDRPIVDFAHQHNWRQFYLLDWLTYLVPIIQYLAIIFIAYFIYRKLLAKPINQQQENFFLISVTLLVATQIKEALKFIFGRYWAATWIHNNPSWLRDHVYGFNFFHYGTAYSSFPSGHAMVTFTVMSMLWLLYPKYRWLYVLICLTMFSAQLILYYHYLSDLIAGSCLGIIVGSLSTFCLKQQAK